MEIIYSNLWYIRFIEGEFVSIYLKLVVELRRLGELLLHWHGLICKAPVQPRHLIRHVALSEHCEELQI